MLYRPHLALPTIWATLEAIYHREIEYSQMRPGNNIANADKHAIWNALIAYHTQPLFATPDAAVNWAKKITDLHEDCFVNHPAERQMDLENNRIGRNYYLELFQQKKKRPSKSNLLEHIKSSEKLIFID